MANIACGITICPAIKGAQDAHQLVTDRDAWWKEQTDQWNATKAYWGGVNDTYQKARSAPLGWVPGVAELYFGLQWSADRLEDFDKDPGTSSANMVVFILSDTRLESHARSRGSAYQRRAGGCCEPPDSFQI